MKEQFLRKRFTPKSYETIDTANAILREYVQQGYDLSLRQLYYQFVARDYLPNSQKSYNNLGSLISDARMAGYVDWNMIRDRGRVSVISNRWDSPAEILDASASQFRIDKWTTQLVYIEVMVEKQALEGVLIPACRTADVRFTANKGYSSSSAVYEASKRMLEAQDDGKDVHVLYLGDHDPSGIDMTRDVGTRLRTFLRIADPDEYEGSEEDYYDQMDRYYDFADNFHVHRLALNMDQVVTYQPPENPAKITDSRAKAYMQRFGDSSWELDALNPSVLANLVIDFVDELRDDEAWEQEVAKEEEMKGYLRQVAVDWKKEHGTASV